MTKRLSLDQTAVVEEIFNNYGERPTEVIKTLTIDVDSFDPEDEFFYLKLVLPSDCPVCVADDEYVFTDLPDTSVMMLANPKELLCGSWETQMYTIAEHLLSQCQMLFSFVKEDIEKAVAGWPVRLFEEDPIYYLNSFALPVKIRITSKTNPNFLTNALLEMSTLWSEEELRKIGNVGWPKHPPVDSDHAFDPNMFS
jgi:hypothetical protein